VAQTFFVDNEMATQLRLDAIVTLVDAKHILDHLDEVKPDGVDNEAVEQVAFADRIVINKIDLVGEEVLDRVEERLRSINAVAQIVRSAHARIDLDLILGVGAFDLGKVLEMDPTFLQETDHLHDTSVTSVGIELEGDLDPERLNAWISRLLREKGVDIFRSKGILAVRGNANRFVFQGVHMLMDSEEARPWGGERRHSRLVFIGRNLDRQGLTTGLRGCLAVPVPV
jgi:G3E family GTPase